MKLRGLRRSSDRQHAVVIGSGQLGVAWSFLLSAYYGHRVTLLSGAADGSGRSNYGDDEIDPEPVLGGRRSDFVVGGSPSVDHIPVVLRGLGVATPRSSASLTNRTEAGGVLSIAELPFSCFSLRSDMHVDFLRRANVRSELAESVGSVFFALPTFAIRPAVQRLDDILGPAWWRSVVTDGIEAHGGKGGSDSSAAPPSSRVRPRAVFVMSKEVDSSGALPHAVLKSVLREVVFNQRGSTQNPDENNGNDSDVKRVAGQGGATQQPLGGSSSFGLTGDEGLYSGKRTGSSAGTEGPGAANDPVNVALDECVGVVGGPFTAFDVDTAASGNPVTACVAGSARVGQNLCSLFPLTAAPKTLRRSSQQQGGPTDGVTQSSRGKDGQSTHSIGDRATTKMAQMSPWAAVQDEANVIVEYTPDVDGLALINAATLPYSVAAGALNTWWLQRCTEQGGRSTGSSMYSYIGKAVAECRALVDEFSTTIPPRDRWAEFDNPRATDGSAAVAGILAHCTPLAKEYVAGRRIAQGIPPTDVFAQEYRRSLGDSVGIKGFRALLTRDGLYPTSHEQQQQQQQQVEEVEVDRTSSKTAHRGDAFATAPLSELLPTVPDAPIFSSPFEQRLPVLHHAIRILDQDVRLEHTVDQILDVTGPSGHPGAKAGAEVSAGRSQSSTVPQASVPGANPRQRAREVLQFVHPMVKMQVLKSQALDAGRHTVEGHDKMKALRQEFDAAEEDEGKAM